MNQYEITTAQNATIRFTIANMGDRILACMIDLLILLGYTFLVGYIEVKFYDKQIAHEYGPNASYLLVFSIFLPVYFYSLLFEYFMNGQTPGKRIRKIKVVRMDGKSLTLGSCIIRWLFRIVDIWLDSGSVAIVVATFSKLHQRVGDMVAGTIVISMVADRSHDLSRYAEVSSPPAIFFPQVDRLELKDMEVVNQALTLYYENDEFEYVLQASARLKAAMGVMPEMDDLTFVKRVLGDYSVINKDPMSEHYN